MNKLSPQKRAGLLASLVGEVAPRIDTEADLQDYIRHVRKADEAREYAKRFLIDALQGKLKGPAPATAVEFFDEFMEQRQQRSELHRLGAKAKREQGEKTVKQVLLAYKNSPLPERSRASAIAKQVGIKAGQVRRIIARQKAASQKLSGAEKNK
jgi:hypothetical protein